MEYYLWDTCKVLVLSQTPGDEVDSVMSQTQELDHFGEWCRRRWRCIDVADMSHTSIIRDYPWRNQQKQDTNDASIIILGHERSWWHWRAICGLMQHKWHQLRFLVSNVVRLRRRITSDTLIDSCFVFVPVELVTNECLCVHSSVLYDVSCW